MKISKQSFKFGQKRGTWITVFAWLPVTTQEGWVVWLSRVNRYRRVFEDDADGNSYSKRYIYRLNG